MDPSSSNTKKRGSSTNEAEEVRDGLKRQSCSSSSLPTGSGHDSTKAGDLIKELYESFMAKKLQEWHPEIEKRMPHSINSLSDDQEYQTQAREEIAHGLFKEREAECESEFRELLMNEFDKIAKLQLKPLPPLPPTKWKKYKLRLCDTIKGTMYYGDEIKSIDDKALKIELCNAYSNTIISTNPISSAMVELFLKEAGSQTPISREKTKELISLNHLEFRLEYGVGYVEGVTLKSNKYWKSNHFVLGVKVIDELILKKIGTVEEASSGSFRVLTKKSKELQKHYPPTMDSETWRLIGIRRNGPYHIILSKLGINSVGDFLRKYHEMGSQALEEILKRGISKLDEWNGIVEHAKTCVGYDPTDYDQTIRPNLEEASYYVENFEVGETDKLPRTVSPNQKYFIDNIDIDNLHLPNYNLEEMTLEPPNPFEIDHRVQQSQELGP